MAVSARVVPCVGAVVLDKSGRVLLVKHIKEKKGFWAEKYICPGGRLEFGETLEEGVRREILEETGLQIDIIRWLPPMERIVRNPDGSVADHVVYLDIVARVKCGSFRAASDVGEGAWFSRRELRQIAGQIHEDTAELLRRVRKLPKT